MRVLGLVLAGVLATSAQITAHADQPGPVGARGNGRSSGWHATPGAGQWEGGWVSPNWRRANPNRGGRRCAICVTPMSGLASIALAASMSSSVSFGGRPPVRPMRRAAARPAWVRSRSKAGPTRSGRSTRMSGFTHSGNISGTPLLAMPDCASIICCSARRPLAAFLPPVSTAMCGPAKGRAITRRSRSDLRTQTPDQRGRRNAGGKIDQADAPLNRRRARWV
jgi:hypothetical protein